MDESTGGIGLADLLRALWSSVDERGRFGEDPRGFLGDRGLENVTQDDVREAVTMSADDLAPAAGVTADVLTAPVPAPQGLAEAGPGNPLDGAIAEISRLMGFVDPEFAIAGGTATMAAVAPDDPPPDEAPVEEEDPGVLESLGDDFVREFKDLGEGTWEGIEGFGGDQAVEGVKEIFSDIAEGGADTLDRVDEELDEASADFDEGDIAAGALGSIAGGLLSPAAAAAETAGDVAGDAAGAAVEIVGDWVGAGAGVVAGAIGFDHDEVQAAVIEGAEFVGGIVDEGIGYVGEGAAYVIEGAGEVVEGVGEVIDEGIEAVGDAAEEVGDWLGL